MKKKKASKKKKVPKKKILDSYKKVGSKFVSPLNQLTNMIGVSFYRRALPELIWWDVLVDEVSLRFSTTLVETIASFLAEIKPPLPIWGGFISEYANLSDETFEDLKKHLYEHNLLVPMLHALDNFFRLYPKCPLVRFLDTHPPEGIDIAYLAKFEKRLEELEYKRSRAAIIMQSHVIYAGFVSGKLNVVKGTSLGDLNELSNYPDTEESKMVGASVCSAVNSCVYNLSPEFKNGTWAVYFWEKSYEFRPLKWEHLNYE
jgi:hypothetical protein